MQQEFKLERQDAERLILMLQEAHYEAGKNNPSISQTVFLNAVHGSANPMSAVAAGLLSTGAMHAPVTEVREMIKFMLDDAEKFAISLLKMVNNGCKIPGVGNSFYKDSIDPAFIPVNDFYRQLHFDNDLGLTYVDSYAQIANQMIKEKTNPEPELIKSDRKELYPNAALITAGIVEFIGGQRFVENWFFIAGRSRAWLELAAKIKTI